MKIKFRKTLIGFLCILVVVAFQSCNKTSNDNSQSYSIHTKKDNSQSYSIHTEIMPGLYFQRDSKTENSIFFADNATSESRKYIIKDKIIFRYATDNNYIAYHWNELVEGAMLDSPVREIQGNKYTITKDYITIYDSSNREYVDFTNQTDFQSFCQTQNIDFSWKYSSGFEPQVTKVDSFEIHDFQSESVCDYVVTEGMVIYEGYISDINITDKQISFRLQIPHTKIWEFQDSENNSLNISFEQSIGRKQVGVLLYEDVYFDEYITLKL